ncbi:MAG: NAD(P)-binding domain-containing protein [Myxococcales bacterium]|nr:NAD(P)-binding domain-containing protein [Myxococcales bacterium]MBK7194927.1 NAD(P)-binding domain-containing protein [Myxococcales bacterium]MBP6846418.1 NAD(P)-binding domain-containing protein [Kofleriaceae bacterium]
MSGFVVIVALVAAAGVPYLAWTWIDRRRHGRAAQIHDDIAALGEDALPSSLHPVIDLDDCIGSGACVRACPEQEILGITDGRARLINPLACVGHGACLAACPVGAIKLVFGTATRGVELPRVNASFETSHPGVYVVGELGGMGLIKNAIAQARQAGDDIARAGRRGRAGELDAIVVGAGPAGLGSALALMAHGLRVLVLEQAAFGGTITHYPRAKVVMTGNLELPGYGTVRRKTMSKEDLLALWDDIRERTQLPIREGVRVDGLIEEAGRWRVIGDGLDEPAANVVLALGRRGAPRQLGVPGEDLAKVSYRMIEPTAFAGRHVLVVGGGNAAADCALGLAGVAASVGLSYRRAELARLRASVRARIEAAFASGAITPHLGTEVVRITEHHVELRRDHHVEALANDDVIVQIGGTPPNQLLKAIGIELVEKRGEA